MPRDHLNLTVDLQWVLNSRLCEERRAELQEIEIHKYYCSEKAGFDVGFDLAQTDWIIKHRLPWRRHFRGRQNNQPSERHYAKLLS